SRPPAVSIVRPTRERADARRSRKLLATRRSRRVRANVIPAEGIAPGLCARTTVLRSAPYATRQRQGSSVEQFPGTRTGGERAIPPAGENYTARRPIEYWSSFAWRGRPRRLDPERPRRRPCAGGRRRFRPPPIPSPEGPAIRARALCR